MATLKEFTLLEGETILAQIEGDAYNDSPNPIIQMVAAFVKIIMLIFGLKLRTYIIATNLRIVQVEKRTILWGMLPGDTIVITLNKSSIQSVGYAMNVSFFVFKKFYFLMANMSGMLRITYKGSKEDLIEACRQMDKVVCEAK